MSIAASQQIVIIGGGIIGCTSAYYLSHHPSFSPQTTTITLIEASTRGIAQGASGKAGGLVAKWADPKELAELSFAEHLRLAHELDGETRWGWRFVRCATWEGRAAGRDRVLTKNTRDLPDDLWWVKENLTDSYTPLDSEKETAQVHPYLFTSSMLDLALSKGIHVITGRATSIRQANGAVTGVTYLATNGQEETLLPATHVILAAGPWSPVLLPSLPISGTRAHSITIHPSVSAPITPYVLFTSIALPDSRSSVAPEIYPRPGPENEVYACSPPDGCPLAPTVDEVEVDEAACASILDYVGSISDVLKQGKVVKRQACFMPMMTSGEAQGPIVGEAKKIAKGLIVAAGHSCWGICNAPATAKAISELVMEGEIRFADFSKFDPINFLRE